MRPIHPIKTEEDYNRAMARLEEIFDAEPNTPEDDELAVLGILIDEYEKEHFPLDMPDPIEAIKIRMEEMGLENKDLAKALGTKSRVSEILNKKRKLSLNMIRKLHRTLNIPTDVLIQEY